MSTCTYDAVRRAIQRVRDAYHETPEEFAARIRMGRDPLVAVERGEAHAMFAEQAVGFLVVARAGDRLSKATREEMLVILAWLTHREASR